MNKIKERRVSANMTQKELADAVGVTQAAVAAWERGLQNPRASRLKKMAKIFKCNLEDLL